MEPSGHLLLEQPLRQQEPIADVLGWVAMLRQGTLPPPEIPFATHRHWKYFENAHSSSPALRASTAEHICMTAVDGVASAPGGAPYMRLLGFQVWAVSRVIHSPLRAAAAPSVRSPHAATPEPAVQAEADQRAEADSSHFDRPYGRSRIRVVSGHACPRLHVESTESRGGGHVATAGSAEGAGTDHVVAEGAWGEYAMALNQSDWQPWLRMVLGEEAWAKTAPKEDSALALLKAVLAEHLPKTALQEHINEEAGQLLRELRQRLAPAVYDVLFDAEGTELLQETVREHLQVASASTHRAAKEAEDGLLARDEL